MQLAYSLGAVFFDDVCYRNDSDKFAVFCEEQRSFAVLSQSFRLLADCVGNFRSLCNVFQVAAGQDCAVQLSGQTAARYSLEVCHFQGIVHAAFFACLQNGAGQRMLALFLQGVGQLQKLRLIDALCRENVRSLRFAACDGSGLIQGYDLSLAGGLQGCCSLEHDAVFRAHSISYHDGYGRRQSQGTGTADNQYGDTSCQREAYALSCQQPDDNGHGCDADNCRYEDAGYPIRDLRDGRFRGRRVADHLDDLG